MCRNGDEQLHLTIEQKSNMPHSSRTRQQRKLLRTLAQNMQWAAQVWQTPTVAEQYGLDLPPSAWADFRSGNADATN